MVTLSLRYGQDAALPSDVLVIPCFQGLPFFQIDRAAAPQAPCGVEAALLRAGGFTAEPGQVAFLPAFGPAVGSVSGAPDLLVVGLGAPAQFSLSVLRHAAQSAALATRHRNRATFTLACLGKDTPGALRAVTEGVLLGRHVTAGSGAGSGAGLPAMPDDAEVFLTLPADAAPSPDLDRAFAVGQVAGRMTNWARGLVDLPPSAKIPATLAAAIADKARGLGIAAEVWDRAAMLANGFGGTLAVGSGSDNAPTVVVLRTTPREGQVPFGLAGKGMTYDSGGINLKRNLTEMFRMKNDMAGAVAVAGALFAAVELGALPDVIAVLPMAENMPGPSAMRPGDILTHPGGRRTEVIDTDCEGRLILADAISYLGLQGVSGIIDVGTLTDGGGVGPLLWGCWANDEALAAQVVAAGETSGDPGWRLPLRREYRAFLQSRLAEIVNAPLSVPDIGLTAATYLADFTPKTPWAHIDNGGTAFMEFEIGGWPVGPTGSPLRALLQFLLDRD